MANQIRNLVGLALLLAAISASAQLTPEVTEPFPYLLLRTIVSELKVETHYPGNFAGIRLRFGSGYQMIVTISVNYSGPYDFLVDTGTQFTIVDSSLAVGLHPSAQGSTTQPCCERT